MKIRTTTGTSQSGIEPIDVNAPLFDGDDLLFKSLAAKCRTYAEYGCGASTVWILRNTSARVHCVDSSRDWIDHVRAQSDAGDRLHAQWADLGPVGKGGRPVSYARRAGFSAYTDWFWQQDIAPDLVLIDGRFRVCCFLTALKHSAAGTKILFDDYTNRAHYHVVEEFIAPQSTCGRQALFVRPETTLLDSDRLDPAIGQFRMVMD